MKNDVHVVTKWSLVCSCQMVVINLSESTTMLASARTLHEELNKKLSMPPVKEREKGFI